MGAPFFCTSRRELEQTVYTVFDAADGDEAVEVFVANYDQIDLVLLDMAMPLMNGDDALVQMRFVDPEVKVLLFTGIVVDWQELKVDGIIQKPFGSGDILDKVYKVLS